MPDRPCPAEPEAGIGAVVVAYNSAPVIGACLESLLGARGVALPVVVVDNASTDGTAAAVRAAARLAGSFAELAATGAPEAPAARLTLVRSAENLGFAGGVNLGLRLLLARPGIDLFWLVNPDCIAEPEAAAAYLAAGRDGAFALMGGRTVFESDRAIVQSDGGRVSRLTAICRNVNQGRRAAEATMPAPETLDFLSGANLVASRRFVERAGPMPEDYFLFYEEVDWALRRGALPLKLCPGAVVSHHGGTATGSGTRGRRPSAFANYYNYRNRLRFAWRRMPWALPGALAYSLGKIAQLWLAGARAEARGALRGLLQLPLRRGARSGTS